jgi:hypothetical protein
MLGYIIFGDEETDIKKIRSRLKLPKKKVIAGKRAIRDIIANGGVKTYQLNNFEIFFDSE